MEFSFGVRLVLPDCVPIVQFLSLRGFAVVLCRHAATDRDQGRNWAPPTGVRNDQIPSSLKIARAERERFSIAGGMAPVLNNAGRGISLLVF
jgi:hypothetical protein